MSLGRNADEAHTIDAPQPVRGLATMPRQSDDHTVCPVGVKPMVSSIPIGKTCAHNSVGARFFRAIWGAFADQLLW
jgi:hypothetical protein